MTKIETLVKLINQSGINCHGVDCCECPFDGLPGGRSRCALLNLDLDGADVEGNIKNAIFDAVDEARKEEVDQKPTTPSRTTPEHYKLTPEPIDVIRGWNLGFCLGNVIKYIARAGRKAGESRDKDLHKAMEYLRMELEDQANEVYEAYKKKNAVNRQRIEEEY